MPGVDHLLEDGGDRWNPARPQRELAQQGKKLRLIGGEPPNALQLRGQLLTGFGPRLECRPEPLHRVPDRSSDQRLLGREVVVQRGDVDAYLGGNIPRSKALEAGLGQPPVGGQHQRLAPRFGFCWLGLAFGQDSGWARNVLAAGEADLRYRGADYHLVEARVVEVADVKRELPPIVRLGNALMGMHKVLRMRQITKA